jgi:hypothetical protein
VCDKVRPPGSALMMGICMRSCRCNSKANVYLEQSKLLSFSRSLVRVPSHACPLCPWQV